MGDGGNPPESTGPGRRYTASSSVSVRVRPCPSMSVRRDAARATRAERGIGETTPHGLQGHALGTEGTEGGHTERSLSTSRRASAVCARIFPAPPRKLPPLPCVPWLIIPIHRQVSPSIAIHRQLPPGIATSGVMGNGRWALGTRISVSAKAWHGRRTLASATGPADTDIGLPYRKLPRIGGMADGGVRAFRRSRGGAAGCRLQAGSLGSLADWPPIIPT
jgi:hypothetical protein